MPSFFSSTIDSLAILRASVAMRGAVELALVDLGIGHHLRRIEHAQLHARGEQTHQRGVDVALFQEALLDGVEVRLVVVIVLHLEGEVDALVVHAALED